LFFFYINEDEFHINTIDSVLNSCWDVYKIVIELSGNLYNGFQFKIAPHVNIKLSYT